MQKPIIKTIQGIEFELVNEVLHRENGLLLKNSYWIEKGKEDSNRDGKISNTTLICVIPEDCEDIDLSKIDENCLTKRGSRLLLDVEINEEAKIKK